MSPISSQQQQLAAALREQGWAVVGNSNELPWWGDEVWVVESGWRPVGLRLHLTFLVDPLEYHPNRRRGEGVWAVRCTQLRPVDDPGSLVEVPLKHWDRRLAELVQRMGEFRDAAAGG